MLLQQFDLLADSALGQVKLTGGAGETAGAHHGFKGDQSVQWRQVTAESTHADDPNLGMATA
ncbi:hypothetical protein D3C77_807070 [compost metagenome]